MPDRIFTLKDWKRIKRDVYDDYFGQQNMNYDLKELAKVEMSGTPEKIQPIPEMGL